MIGLVAACSRGLAKRPLPDVDATPSEAAGPRDAEPAPFPKVKVVEPVFPPSFGTRKVYVDPGHGAPNNPGNTSSFCLEEQEFSLATAKALAARLTATGHFTVKLARPDDTPVAYEDRVDAAQAFGADAFVSIHSDVRGDALRWSPEPGKSCPVSYGATGFAVLFSDECDAGLCARRGKLARSVAKTMSAAGFVPYTGRAYVGLYDADAAEAGVFLDRHAPGKRIFVLKKPTMPSVLVETHHALDPGEARAWDEPATLDAFGAAVAVALVDALAR